MKPPSFSPQSSDSDVQEVTPKISFEKPKKSKKSKKEKKSKKSKKKSRRRSRSRSRDRSPEGNAF